MAQLVADYLMQRLREWGVYRIYGYPGDGINGIMGALNRADGDPAFVQVRHEEMAAFMACGHAKFTGEVGVCLATSGPGAIHLLNGLYDAKCDHQPVVAIVGQQSRTALGGHYQQEVDLQSLFKDVCSEYVQTVMVSEQLPGVLDRAIRIARSERAPTCVIVPADLQEETYDAPEHAFKHILSSASYTAAPEVTAPEAEIRRAARVLNEGSRVAVLVGQGARRAVDEVLEVCDLLGAGVAKALLGIDVIPDDVPFCTGAIGLLGTRPSYDLMMGCDTLLMVGTSFPYVQFLPKPGQARGVEIDISGKMIGIRYPNEVNLVGDARDTLRKLIPLLERNPDRAWQEELQAGVQRWRRVLQKHAMTEAKPLNPQRVFYELSPRLPERCIVTCDSGSAANWFARDLKFRRGMRASISGTLATMGCAVPYAVAAKMCFPDRPVIACVGDGAMQMNGMNELLTIARYKDEWSDPRLIVLVLHNDDLTQVTWEMRAMAGDPKYEASQRLPCFDYARYAELCGLTGFRMESPDQVGPIWEQVLAAKGPVVVEAITDPNVPPLPPHVSFEQAVSLAKSVLKGDPELGDVVRQSWKHKVKEVFTR